MFLSHRVDFLGWDGMEWVFIDWNGMGEFGRRVGLAWVFREILLFSTIDDDDA